MDTGLPAGIAGLELPVNVDVPVPLLVSVSVESTEPAATSTGAEMAGVDTLIVTAVPSWVAVSVAVPDP